MQSARPYESWPLIDGIEINGWRVGTMMRYVGERWGDAFVEAPDGRRAGVVWVIRDGPITQLVPPDETRWGVYEVPFERDMLGVEDLRNNFRAVVCQLAALYEAVMANPSFQRTASPPLD